MGCEERGRDPAALVGGVCRRESRCSGGGSSTAPISSSAPAASLAQLGGPGHSGGPCSLRGLGALSSLLAMGTGWDVCALLSTALFTAQAFPQTNIKISQGECKALIAAGGEGNLKL